MGTEEFPGGLVLRIPGFHYWSLGLRPEIPQAVQKSSPPQHPKKGAENISQHNQGIVDKLKVLSYLSVYDIRFGAPERSQTPCHDVCGQTEWVWPPSLMGVGGKKCKSAVLDLAGP